MLRAFPPALGAVEGLAGTSWLYLPGTKSMPSARSGSNSPYQPRSRFPFGSSRNRSKAQMPRFPSHQGRGEEQVLAASQLCSPPGAPGPGWGFGYNFLVVVFLTEPNFQVAILNPSRRSDADVREPTGTEKVGEQEGVSRKQGGEDVGSFGLSKSCPLVLWGQRHSSGWEQLCPERGQGELRPCGEEHPEFHFPELEFSHRRTLPARGSVLLLLLLLPFPRPSNLN